MSSDLFAPIRSGPLNTAQVVPATGAELRSTSFRNTMDNLRFNARQEVLSGVMDDVLKPLYADVEAATGETDLYNKARGQGGRKMMSVGGAPPEATDLSYAQYLAVREDLEKRGVKDIMPWENIIAGGAARANFSREEFEEDATFNTSSAAWLQTMLGDAGASLFHDPLMAASVAATVPFGVATPLRMAAAEMTAAGIAATGAQINIKAWQEEIGNEYTTEDAVRAVIGEMLVVGGATATLTKGLNLVGMRPGRLVEGPSAAVSRTIDLRNALIHRKVKDGTLFQPLQTPVQTIYDVADALPPGAARDSLWATARDMQLLDANPAARAYDDGMYIPTAREQELHQVNLTNTVRSMATGEPLRVRYQAELAPDLFKASDDAAAVSRVVELEAENIVPDLTTRAYQRKLGQWVREAFVPKLLSDLDAIRDTAAKALPTKPAKTVKQLATAVKRAEARLAKLQGEWREKMPQFNKQIVEARATKTAKNLKKQRTQLDEQYRQDVQKTRADFAEARREHKIRRGTKDYERSRRAEQTKVKKLTKAYEKEKTRLSSLTDEAANLKRIRQLEKDKARFDKTTDAEMSRLRAEIKRLNESTARRQKYDAIKSAKADMPNLERQLAMLERGKIPKELKAQADTMHAAIERQVGDAKRFAEVTIDPDAKLITDDMLDDRSPRPLTPPAQMKREHKTLMEQVPARETAEELEERATKLYEAATERAADRVKVHKELTRTIRDKKVTRDALRDFYNRVNTAAERKVNDMLGELDQFVDRVGARGLRLVHNREFMLKVTEGLINGVETVDSVYRPVVKELKELMARQMEEFRALGGHIGEIEGYFPLRHNRQALKDAGFEAWYDSYLRMNDLDRIIDFETGAAMTEPRFREIAKAMFDDIVTDGYGSQFKPAGSTIARRMDSRFSRPKDYDAFMEYSREFGAQEGDLYALLVSNLRDMSHDLGIMKELGPKPHKVHRDLMNEFGSEMTKAERDHIDGYYRTLVGHWSGDNADSLVARTAQGAMDLASHMLGSAPLAALGDPIFAMSTARMNGLSQTGAMKAAAKNLANIAGDPDEVLRTYHLAEALTHSASHRFSPHGDMGGFGKANNALADMKNIGHRMSGLQKLTLVMADAMSLDFASELGTRIATKTSWEDLNPRFQRLLRLNDINAEDWGRLLEFPVDERGMVTGRMLPEELADIGEKLGNVEVELRNTAINAPDLRSRIYATGNRWGERARGDNAHLASALTMQFKSFMVQVWANHLLPSLQAAMKGELGPLTGLLITGAVVGPMVVQLREAAKGNPTYEWSDPRLLMRGLAQSGIGGILGDMALKDPNQYGRNLLLELMGPVPSVTADLAMEGWKQTVGVAWSRDPYAEPNFSPLMRAARPLVPFSNLWYTKAGFDLMITDTIDEMIDPGFRDRMAREKKRFAEERGSAEAWWQ